MFKFSLFSFILLASGICIPSDMKLKKIKNIKFVVFHKHYDPMQTPQVCHTNCFNSYQKKKLEKTSYKPVVIAFASNTRELFELPRIFYGTGTTSVECKGCSSRITEKLGWRK